MIVDIVPVRKKRRFNTFLNLIEAFLKKIFLLILLLRINYKEGKKSLKKKETHFFFFYFTKENSRTQSKEKRIDKLV